MDDAVIGEIFLLLVLNELGRLMGDHSVDVLCDEVLVGTVVLIGWVLLLDDY